MAQFKIIYYVILVMSFLLLTVFIWGGITYKKVKTRIKFLNRPLLTLTLTIGIIAFLFAWVPIFLQVWKYDDEFVKKDLVFILILVFEFLFLVGFLLLAYVFAFDFGIALEEDETKLQFFGQTINTNKIIALEEKKYGLKIVYEQGYKNIQKKVTLFTPNAKKFAIKILTHIILANQKARKENKAAVLSTNITAENTNEKIKNNDDEK